MKLQNTSGQAKSGLLLSAGVAALITAFGATSAQAQVDVIVVEAERTEEDIQDVPIAITAFTSDELEARQITEPLDLVDNIPNLFGSNNFGPGSANTYFIRGQGNTELIATFDPPVGTYVDETYIARQNANNVAFFDIERVEVLRGPQGTLFGRNTTGGAVSVFMKKPKDEFGGFLEAGYGSFDRFVARGSVDLPASDTLLTKFSAYYVHDEGYVDNIATGETLNGQEGFGLRADLRWLASDRVTLDLALEYSIEESTNIINYPRTQSPFGLDDEASNLGDRISNTGVSTRNGRGSPLTQALNGEGLGNEVETFFAAANLGVDVGDTGAINLIVSHRELNHDFILDFFDGGLGGQQFTTGGFIIARTGDHNQTSVEVKYTGSHVDGFVDVVTGLFYFTESNVVDFADIFTLGNGTPLILADRILDNGLDSYAAYAQFDLNFTDQLTVTLGGRVTREEKDIGFSDNRPGGPLTTAAIQAAGIATEQKVTVFTPRFAINYDWTDDISTYASVTRGFKSGGWNARGTAATSILPFGPEKVWNYEAGLRSILFDNIVRFNLTGFYMDVQDSQVPSAFIPPGGGAPQFITQNFADAEVYGAEVELTVAPTPELNLFASLGLQKSKYVNVNPSVAQQALDCLTDPTQGGLGIVAPDCSISRIVRTPEATFSIGGTYDFYIGNVVITPSVSGRLVSSTFTGTSNLPNGFEDGYFLLNTGLKIASDDNGFSLSVNCKNCLDTAYVQNNLPPVISISEPRRWGVTVRKEF